MRRKDGALLASTKRVLLSFPMRWKDDRHVVGKRTRRPPQEFFDGGLVLEEDVITMTKFVITNSYTIVENVERVFYSLTPAGLVMREEAV